MSNIKDVYQSGDWKAEKHVPAIKAPDAIKLGQAFKITVKVGEEIAHPNTTEHHISWIAVYFHPDGEKFPVEIGKFDFTAHGASAKGPNTSTIVTEPCVEVSFKTEKSGTILATSYCNIHGLWESSKNLKVE
ncbi:MAG TPA: class II SORL domain-containing protein [Candidatus Omnitrophota bacterium]|nr:class II SORL domain-containing protein [Candidatus Omnitrophota bacterium]HPN87836.1 class II SORL domain-containing protein [Candidatus Omnitrophota bacterium]